MMSTTHHRDFSYFFDKEGVIFETVINCLDDETSIFSSYFVNHVANNIQITGFANNAKRLIFFSISSIGRLSPRNKICVVFTVNSCCCDILKSFITLEEEMYTCRTKIYI